MSIIKKIKNAVKEEIFHVAKSKKISLTVQKLNFTTAIKQYLILVL